MEAGPMQMGREENGPLYPTLCFNCDNGDFPPGRDPSKAREVRSGKLGTKPGKTLLRSLAEIPLPRLRRRDSRRPVEERSSGKGPPIVRPGWSSRPRATHSALSWQLRIIEQQTAQPS